MLDIFNWTTMISIFVGLSLMGAAVANFANIFRKEKEDNIVFNAISWLPRFVLTSLRLKLTYIRIALMSVILGVTIGWLNVQLIVIFG
ncbi:hypothetical protein LP7551_03010 [Roseibium album]|nr:hypothetical protein LP7551_03010 [Roseibium album]